MLTVRYQPAQDQPVDGSQSSWQPVNPQNGPPLQLLLAQDDRGVPASPEPPIGFETFDDCAFVPWTGFPVSAPGLLT